VIWKASNILSALIAGFIAKDRIHAIIIKRSIFVTINRFFEVCAFFILTCFCITVFFIAFNLFNSQTALLEFFKHSVKNIESHRVFGSNKKQVQVFVNNLGIVSEAEVNKTILKHTANKHILLVNLNDIARDLMQIDFVKDVYIKKRFFNSIKIIIYERSISFVILSTNQDGVKDLFFIDNQGSIVIPQTQIIPDSLSNTPIVYTDCYNDNFIKDLLQLQNVIFISNDLYKAISKMDFYECKNWRLSLKNGDVLLLDEKNEPTSVYKYMINKQKIDQLENHPYRVDLRFEGKIYIKPLS
jgi:cell division septal protein FtsQ